VVVVVVVIVVVVGVGVGVDVGKFWDLYQLVPSPFALPSPVARPLQHDAWPQVQDLCTRLVVVPGDDGLSREAQRNATVMFMSLLRGA
jgi:hypothetical protein